MEEISYRETHRVQSNHWWYQGRLDIIAGVLERHLQRDAKLDILEIGAGSGVNLPRLLDYGSVDAVEMHPGGREMIRAAFPGVQVRDGALPDPSLFGGKMYDAVCLFDVLEHVEPHIEALRVIRAHTAPSGRLFLTVPAYQWLWSQHDVAMHHFRRYSRTSLTAAFTESGWRAIRVGYFNTYLFPFAIAARLKDRVTKPAISTGLDLPGNGANSLLRKVFSGEASRVAAGGYPFGLSLMAVASWDEN